MIALFIFVAWGKKMLYIFIGKVGPLLKNSSAWIRPIVYTMVTMKKEFAHIFNLSLI